MPTTNAVVSPGEAPLTTGALAPGGDLSIFLATPATANPYQTYVDAFESIELAEALGYSYAWIAEAHFSSNFGIPTALPFLAAVTQRVSRIALGTAVIPLAFDVPLRLAESAALVNVLTHDRLELGVGKGNPRGSTDAYNAFGLNEGDRDALFAKSIEALKNALRGEVDLGDHRVSLYPPAVTLLDRIWQATGDHATANAAGAAGDGLMLFRTTPDGVAGDVQSLVIDSYLRNFDLTRSEPRIGVSRSLLLAGSRADRAREATLVRAGAMGHSARTVEHFRRWGLLQAIRDEWTFPPEWNQGTRFVTSLVGHDLAQNPRPPFAATPGAERPKVAAEGIRRPQTVLQKVFLGHLGLHGVSVAGGWRVEALTEDADGVAVGVADIDSGDRRSIRARYVIGADGGSSTVRRLAGIDRDGDRAPAKRLRLIVRTGDETRRLGPAPSGVNLVFNAKAWGFLAAVSTREWRVYAGPFPLDYEPANAELIDIGRAAFGYDLDLEVASATTYYDSSRIAQTFRKGRVLLAGDAAHVRTPGGNLGEGFGDVVNLGWKLAAVLAGHAPEDLLDS